MKKTSIGIAVIAGLIFCTTIFIGCRSHGSQRGLAFGLDYISEILDLTAAQESHLAQIKDEIQAKMDLVHKDKKAMHALLKEQLGSDRMDTAVVKDLVAGHRERMNQVIDLAVDRLILFHNKLSPDQKAKLIKKIEKFEAWHNKEW
ncbi:MAG: Spy/CpxP family protein refolding chaperone [Proteobacteria bacterium]|nr:periplasmic heavy metal sensor [Desulfobacula sp.]MBU3952948.1 Spy/CpxP family protein refolding chaperone [Pseudomonadota bacterium]MBU4133410.1 Spy/CpxP family protein refolding chaperone [Pseudomonadota bacterium]